MSHSATIVAETGSPAFSAKNTFRYTRHQDQFEQVMAYYWVTEAQKYIHSLGFGESRRPIDNRPQAVRINQFGQDNSVATDHPKNELRFGKGGVDDAEDAEVILHEYGHAIHFAQNFVFGSEQAGAISEGFSDDLRSPVVRRIFIRCYVRLHCSQAGQRSERGAAASATGSRCRSCTRS
jgi:hypothetical protein